MFLLMNYNIYMKQNQIRSSEIPLEPWSNEQQLDYFAKDTHAKASAIVEPKKRNVRLQQKRPNSQNQRPSIKKLNKQPSWHFMNEAKNLREHYQKTLNALNQKQQSKGNLYENSVDKEIFQTKISPLGTNYYIKKLYSKVAINTTNIEYFDSSKTKKQIRSAGKSRKSALSQSYLTTLPRPATSGNSFYQKKSLQTKNRKSQINCRTMDMTLKVHDVDNRLAVNANQFQKLLKLKQKVRQRNKIHSNRKDKERQMNIRQKKVINFSQNPEYHTQQNPEFEVALQSIRQSDNEVQYTYRFLNSPICHERSIRMMNYRKKRNKSLYGRIPYGQIQQQK